MRISLSFPRVASRCCHRSDRKTSVSNRTGYRRMWVGALFLSLQVRPIGDAILLGSSKTLRLYNDLNIVAETFGWKRGSYLRRACVTRP